MQDKAQLIYVTMVKQQRELENTFKPKMDRDFKEKSDSMTIKIDKMIIDIEQQVGKLSDTIED